MNHHDGPIFPDRLSEVGTILAAGVLRLHRRAALPAAVDQDQSPENPPENLEDSLELPDKTVLSVHTGKRFARPGERTTR
jgi:hypothetical protein